MESTRASLTNLYSTIESGVKSMSTKQQIAAASVGSCMVLTALIQLKKKRDFARSLAALKAAGYHETDPMTTLCASISARESSRQSINIDGFHTCSDDFSFDECIKFWTNISIEHICFRSVLHYHLDTYFWIECCKNKDRNGKKEFSSEENRQLLSRLDRSDFYNQYGFDIMERIKLSHTIKSTP